MAENEVEKPGRLPDTWPGVVSHLIELAAESWPKLVRVIIVVVLLCGVVWLITHSWTNSAMQWLQR